MCINIAYAKRRLIKSTVHIDAKTWYYYISILYLVSLSNVLLCCVYQNMV
jgi:hypothetical protein